MKNLSTLLLTALMVILASRSEASITFTSGKWQTTFNCAEQTQFVGTLNCDGLEWGHNYTLVPGKTTQIHSDANNASGAGGRGARFWIGEGQNNNTGTLNLVFPSYQKEMWVRWYIKHQAGMAFSSLEDDKNLYIWSAGNVTQVIPEFYTNVYRLASQSTPDPNPVITSGWGWNQLNGGATGDGQWHCFEIYLKMDTNGSNGVGRLWVDGVLRASNTAVNWSNNSATAQLGWDHIIFEENQKYVSGGPYAIDYDDMVVYNTTPPNVDTSGNPMIGPITTAPSSALVTQGFEAAINNTGGWIDGAMTDIVSGGHTGNMMRWHWAQGATQPDGSTTVRYTLPADQESIFTRMYVKFDSNWIGSNQTYHPHMLMWLSGTDVASSAYSPLANSYLNNYIEFIADRASPYTLRPTFAYQDQKRVNTSNGTPPVNLLNVTENRSTGSCNQTVPTGFSGICYADAPYYSGGIIANSSVTIPKGQWVQVDTWMKMNSISGGKGVANGEMQMWVDGVLAYGSTTMMYRTNQHPTMGFRQMILAPWIGDGSPISQTMYMDDLEVYSTNLRASSGTTITCYQDADNDLYGHSVSESVTTCSSGYYQAAHFTSLVGDCSDTNAAIHPGATDIPNNGVDEDCSGSDATTTSAPRTPFNTSGRAVINGSGATPVRWQ